MKIIRHFIFNSTFMLIMLALIVLVVFVFNYKTFNVVAKTNNKVPKAIEQRIIKKTQSLIGNKNVLKDIKVSTTDIANIYEINLAGELLYITSDTKFLFVGSKLINLDKNIDLTNRSLNEHRKTLLNDIEKFNLLTWKAKNKKATIYVASDIDCPFCRKFHTQISKLNNSGIEVKYLAFPRAGVNSNSYKKYVTAVCSKNSIATMDKLMKNPQIDKFITCKNDVAQQFDFGRKLGVKGTPTIFFTDGSAITGYVSAVEIIIKADDVSGK